MKLIDNFKRLFGRKQIAAPQRQTEYFCNKSVGEAMAVCKADGYMPISVSLAVDKIEHFTNGKRVIKYYYVVIGERYV